jgi:hypothetical protein
VKRKDQHVNGNGNGNGLSLSYGNAALTARGTIVIWAVLVAIVCIAIIYTANRIEAEVRLHRIEAQNDNFSWRSEVAALRRAYDRQTCVTLYDFKERKYFREKERQTSIDIWAQMCPWIDVPLEQRRFG